MRSRAASAPANTRASLGTRVHAGPLSHKLAVIIGFLSDNALTGGGSMSPRLKMSEAACQQPTSIPRRSRHDYTRSNTVPFMKTEPPEWLLAFWKEIDDKTFGKGFDCFAEDAVCNLGVAGWHGREAIRTNLKAFIDARALPRITTWVEYWGHMAARSRSFAESSP